VAKSMVYPFFEPEHFDLTLQEAGSTVRTWWVIFA